MCNICNIARRLGDYVRKTDQKDLFLLMDAVDALSIDIIEELKSQLFNLAIKESKSLDKNLYIVISTNQYEFCSGEDCIDAHNGTHVKFKDYNEYREFVLKTRRVKDKRYKD